MRSRVLLAGLVLGVAPGAGCALVGDPCAAPVTGTATYVSGSTPPPYHHEWTVRLEESAGSVTWSPGYGAPESWSATFIPDAAAVAAACRAVRRVDEGGTPTGGGTLTLRWRGGEGRTTSLTTPDQRAVDAVQAAVPADAWQQAAGAYERWQQARRR